MDLWVEASGRGGSAAQQRGRDGVHTVSVKGALGSMGGEEGGRERLEPRSLAPFTGQTWKRGPGREQSPGGVRVGRQDEETRLVSTRAELSQVAFSLVTSLVVFRQPPPDRFQGTMGKWSFLILRVGGIRTSF